MPFVDAYSKTTGRHHRVPSHFLADPILGRDLTEQPPDNADLTEAPPNKSWSKAQLETYAETHRIDLKGATRKADILAAVTDPNRRTITPDSTAPDESTTETPPGGENQE